MAQQAIKKVASLPPKILFISPSALPTTLPAAMHIMCASQPMSVQRAGAVQAGLVFEICVPNARS